MSAVALRLLSIAGIGAGVLLITGHGAAPVRAQSAVAVSMISNQFGPATLTIATGTTVTWVNIEDPNGTDVTHDVEPDDTSWGSGYLDPGQSYSYTFTAPGTYHYVCDLHDGMEGTVIVQ